MKKTLLASLLLALAGSALALDVGVVGGYDYSGPSNRGFSGVTIGQKFDKLGVTAGFERSTVGEAQNRYSLVGSYNVGKVGAVTVVGKGGIAYLDNAVSTTGWAAQVGAGLELPVAKKLTAIVDYRYQVGQTRVNQFDGSSLLAGLKYSF
jgi:opacity protein-like surface antigen